MRARGPDGRFIRTNRKTGRKYPIRRQRRSVESVTDSVADEMEVMDGEIPAKEYARQEEESHEFI